MIIKILILNAFVFLYGDLIKIEFYNIALKFEVKLFLHNSTEHSWFASSVITQHLILI